MSSYWAGYSGIGMCLNVSEFELFKTQYLLKNEEDLKKIKEKLQFEDEENIEEYILEKENILKLTDDFAEGFVFYPYFVDEKPNTEYHDTSLSLYEQNAYIFIADFDNNSVGALLENKKYNSYTEISHEFKRKFAKYLPSEFDWNKHIGQFSYACYA